MTVRKISAAEALHKLGQFDAVIDARSPGEFAEDRVHGAENWPSLDDDERKEVGTDYAQVGGFEAKKIGAALVARNIAEHIETRVKDLPSSWKPLVYCWRGGKRSGTLAWFLDQIGFETTLIDGGYKAARAALVADLESLPARLQFNVVCGKTGTGKTRLLHALAAAGAQVLDLEALAEHRGSVLGLEPGAKQPSQKMFDTRVWAALHAFDPAQPVWVESESKKVGNVQVAPALIEHMRATGQCFRIELTDSERVALLLEEYDFFVRDTEFFCSRLDALRPLRGHAVIDAWSEAARSGQHAQVFAALIQKHYDPVYLQSMERNFAGYAAASVLHPSDHSRAAFGVLASDLLGWGMSR
jgi:tRNA 2-selenouridine synthase